MGSSVFRSQGQLMGDIQYCADFLADNWMFPPLFAW